MVLDKDDLFAQLQCIKDRYDQLEKEEMIWANKILSRCMKRYDAAKAFLEV